MYYKAYKYYYWIRMKNIIHITKCIDIKLISFKLCDNIFQYEYIYSFHKICCSITLFKIIYKEEENIFKGWYISRAVISSDVHCTQSIVQKGKMGPVCHALNNNKHESKQYKK